MQFNVMPRTRWMNYFNVEMACFPCLTTHSAAMMLTNNFFFMHQLMTLLHYFLFFFFIFYYVWRDMYQVLIHDGRVANALGCNARGHISEIYFLESIQSLAEGLEMVCVTLWNLLRPAMSAVLTAVLIITMLTRWTAIINNRQSSYTHTHVNVNIY